MDVDLERDEVQYNRSSIMLGRNGTIDEAVRCDSSEHEVAK